MANSEATLLKSRLFKILIPLGAVGGALLLGAVMLLALGANPLSGYATMFAAAFGDL